jgi:DNA-3-methyladenine glycosylase II
MALRQALPRRVGHQRVMMIGGLGQPEQRLQEAVHMGGRQQVLAASHQRHALQRIVERDREMVAGGRVLARQDHVAQEGRIDRDAPMRAIGEVEPSNPPRPLGGIQAQGIGASRRDAFAPFQGWEMPAGAGIGAMLEPVRRLPSRRDLRARAETRIDEALALEPRQGGGVVIEMLGLAAHRPLPVEAEPGEVFVDGGLELGPRACAVDILDAQQEATGLPLGRAPGKEGRMSVTQMKPAGRAGRKARDGKAGVHDGAQDVRQAARPGNRRADPGLVALAELAGRDPDIEEAWALVGDPPPRRRPKGFPALVGSIVGQQVSAAAARAIWTRLLAAGPLTPERFLAFTDEELRAIGFSRQKILYVRGIAEAIASGALDFRRLHRMADEDAIAELVRLKGIGRWTAEIYLLFGLQRLDIWPADDLGLQVGVQRLKRLESRPGRAALIEIAEPWRPWRGVAARFLWHYYHVTGRRDDPAPIQG